LLLIKIQKKPERLILQAFRPVSVAGDERIEPLVRLLYPSQIPLFSAFLPLIQFRLRGTLWYPPMKAYFVKK
jgi:hypothetical protein